MSRPTSLSTRLLRRVGLASISAAPSPRYKGALLGLVGGLVGTLAMGQYWLKVAPSIQPPEPDQDPEDQAATDKAAKDQEPQPDQHVISPLGQQHENGEGPTAALGRFAYELVNHKTPGDQTRAALSEAVHWAMGAGSGALYGALSARSGAGVLGGGVFGAALWLSVDEALVPLLGLQDGPASSGPTGHVNRLGAHLAFGAALGLTVWALERALPE